MSQLRAFDLALAPDKRSGPFVVCGREVLDRLLQPLGTAKARAGQGLSGQDAEPDLDLVKPARRSRREVESDIGVSGKPSVVLLMGAVVVEDDVDVAVGRLVFNDLGHEGLEVDALFGLCGLAADDPGGHLQGGEEVDRAMPFVGALEALNDLPAAGLNIAGRPLQGLDRRLFVDTEHQRMLRGVQVQADNIRRFRGKLRVGTDAPRAMPAQLNAFFAQDPPNRGIRNAERRGQGTAIPPGQPWWRRQLQLPQNAQPHLRTVSRFLARPRLIAQPGHTPCRKPRAPQTDGVWPYPKLARHLVIALTIQASENDLGTLNQTGFLGPTTGKVHQLSSLLGRTRQRHRDPRHATPQLVCEPEVSL